MPSQTPDSPRPSRKAAPARTSGTARRAGRGWWLASGILAVGCLGTAAWLVPTLATEGHEVRTQGRLSLPQDTASAGTVVRDLPQDAQAPGQDEVRKALQQASAGFHGGSLTGEVLDASTGRSLYRVEAEKPVKPASNLKILTATTLLSTSDPASRYTTSAYAHGDHGLTLVAGGDTLLSSGAGDPGAVLGHAGLQDLAQQTVAQLDRQGRTGQQSVDLDETRFQDPGLSSAWAPEDVQTGFVTGVHAIALWDHHTQQMADPESPQDRPADAAQDAWDAYLGALNTAGAEHGMSFVPGQRAQEPTSTDGEHPLASVHSATVQQQAQFMMENSDNVLAEVLGRNAAVAAGKPGSQQGGIETVEQALERQGISTAGLHQADLCGLSAEDRLTPATLAQTLAASTRSRTATARLGSVMPVAGGTGTLAQRFDDEDEAAARGYARAKTGTLLSVNSLSGTTVTRSGRVLAYSLIVNDVTDGTEAKNALDRSVAALTQL